METNFVIILIITIISITIIIIMTIIIIIPTFLMFDMKVGGCSCFLFEESIFIIAGFMEKFLRIKQPENEGGNLFSFDAAIADG